MPSHEPGLSSLNELRRQRHRQITTMRSPMSAIPPKLFLGGLLVLALGSVIYFRQESNRLTEHKNRILAKQRAIAVELGPRLAPLDQTIRSGVSKLLDPKTEQKLEHGQDSWLKEPLVYLRLRAEDAREPVRFRRALRESLRDGFSSCLAGDAHAPLPSSGKACQRSEECQPGELCTEFAVCQRPISPFNLKVVYRALTPISSEWVKEVKEASSELALVAYERGLESATRVDVPAAIEVYQRARHLVLVLDEEAKDPLPARVTDETDFERLQRTAHRAKIGVFSLPSGETELIMTSSATGELRDVGKHTKRGGAEAEADRARQVNSCALALDLRSRLTGEELLEAP